LIRKFWIVGLKYAVTVAAIYFLFSSGRLRFSDLHIARDGWTWIASAALMCLLFMTLIQVRYWAILRSCGGDFTIWRVLRAGFIAWFFNTSLLGGVGFLSGDAIRAAYLMRGNNRKTTIVGATLLDRFIGIAGLLTLPTLALVVGWNCSATYFEGSRTIAVFYGLFVAAGLSSLLFFVALAWGRLTAVATWAVAGGTGFFWLARIPDSTSEAAGWIFIPLVVALVAPVLLPGGRLQKSLNRWGQPGKVLNDLISTVVEFRRRPGTLSCAWLLSVAIHFLWMTGVFFSAQAIVIPVAPTFMQVWFAAPPANATNILPLPASGLGIGETAFDTLLRLCTGPGGATVVGGAAAYLTFRIVMMLTALSGAPVYLASGKSGPWKKTGGEGSNSAGEES